MKPIIKYRGGKAKEIPYLIKHVPQYTGTYIEPFFGGGALFFHLEPQHAIINDINEKLMKFYMGVRDDFQKLKIELENVEHIYNQNREQFERLKTKHPQERVDDPNERFYYQLRDMFNGLSPKSYSDALLYYFINKTSYSGMIRYNSKGDFNVPYGRYKRINTQNVTVEHSSLLAKADIHIGDYQDVFALANVNDFMFLDPPYDCIFSDYGNEEYKDGFGEKSHRQLAEDIRNLNCRVLMVIGATPLTLDLYRNNIIGEYQKTYAVNIRNRFKSAAKHILVSNY